MQGNEIQHVFLVGAKSLGAYGGYETFVNKLTEYHQDHPKIRYHVACKANGEGSMDPAQTRGAQIISDRLFLYHNAHCFRVKIPEKNRPGPGHLLRCNGPLPELQADPEGKAPASRRLHHGLPDRPLYEALLP